MLHTYTHTYTLPTTWVYAAAEVSKEKQCYCLHGGKKRLNLGKSKYDVLSLAYCLTPKSTANILNPATAVLAGGHQIHKLM